MDHYREEDFGDERVNISGPVSPPFDERMPIREVVKKTLAVWEDILEDRYRNEDVVFAARLMEKGYGTNCMEEYRFFSDYSDAFACLSHEKQEYLEDEELRNIETIGEIRRIKMGGGYDTCYFDTQMRLVELGEDEQVLKLLRAVRQGKLDWYVLLHKYGRRELEQVLKWNL